MKAIECWNRALKTTCVPFSRFYPRNDKPCCFLPRKQKKSKIWLVFPLTKRQQSTWKFPVKHNLATAAGLEQGYVTCPSEKRFLLLFTFLKKNKNKKIMVFFSSCNSVKFHAELLNYIDVPVMDIHGRQKQVKRTTTFFQFCKSETGTLLCTDVAARGLDIPKVDWIIQFDPPDDPKEYIHVSYRLLGQCALIGKAMHLYSQLPCCLV